MSEQDEQDERVVTLARAIFAMLKDCGGEWRGSVHKLVDELELGVVASQKAASDRLKNCDVLFKKMGIYTKTEIVNGIRIKTLSLRPIVRSNETKQQSLCDSMPVCVKLHNSTRSLEK